MDFFQPNRRKYYEPLGEIAQTSVPSFEQPPKMEQKPLPSHLRYAYLGDASTLLVIISASLTAVEEDKLLRVIRDHKCSGPQARSDPNGEFEPKPGDARFISFIFIVINFFFSKMSRPESPARPEWRIQIGARFTPTFSIIFSKHFVCFY